MTVEEFLISRDSVAGLEKGHLLSEFDALFESILVDARLDFVRNELMLLVHGMGMPDRLNSGVVVIHSVSEFGWTAGSTSTRTLRTIEPWAIEMIGAVCAVTARDWAGGSLTARGSAVELIGGRIERADNSLPDFGESSSSELKRALVSWDAEFEPLTREVLGDVPAVDR